MSDNSNNNNKDGTEASITSYNSKEFDQRLDDEDNVQSEFANSWTAERDSIFGKEGIETLKERSIRFLEDSIELLPLEQKKAYLIATKVAPNVIQIESNPLRFLKFENYNPWAAAVRLTSYWEYRDRIFGTNAYKLLTLSSKNGPFSEGDLELIRSGYCFVLPPTESQHRIMWVDRSRLPKNRQIESAQEARLLFFAFQRLLNLSYEDKTQYTCVVSINSFDAVNFPPEVTEQINHMYLNCLPFEFGYTHLLCCPPKDREHYVYNNALPTFFRQASKLFTNKYKVHKSTSITDLTEMLWLEEIDAKQLSEFLGGDRRIFDLWLATNGYEIPISEVKLNPLSTNKEGKSMPTMVDNSSQEPNAICADTDDDAKTDQIPLDDVKQPSRSDFRPTVSVNSISSSPSDSDDKEGDTKTNNKFLDRYKWSNFSFTDKQDFVDHAFNFNERKIGTVTNAKSQEKAKLKLLQQAIDKIPDCEKAAYLEVEANASHLLYLECKAVHYANNNFDSIESAARSLVGYWEYRKEIFEERWLMPLTLLGDGALDKEDAKLLKSASLLLIQTASKDGTCVLYYDIAAASHNITENSYKSVVRCFFYLLSVAAESEVSRTIGLHIVYNYGPSTVIDDHTTTISRHLLNLISKRLIPVKSNSIHFLRVKASRTFAATHGPSATLTPEQHMFQALQFIHSLPTKSIKPVIHSGKSTSNVTESLQESGFEKADLPKQIGGMWSHKRDFTYWWGDRERIEFARFSQLKKKLEKTSSVGPTTQDNAEPGDPVGVLPECDTLRHKKRIMNTIYARRKRERKRVEIEVLQQRCVNLRNNNDDLAIKNEKLDELLTLSNGIVANYKETSAATASNSPNNAEATLHNLLAELGGNANNSINTTNTHTHKAFANSGVSPLANTNNNNGLHGQQQSHPMFSGFAHADANPQVQNNSLNIQQLQALLALTGNSFTGNNVTITNPSLQVQQLHALMSGNTRGNAAGLNQIPQQSSDGAVLQELLRALNTRHGGP